MLAKLNPMEILDTLRFGFLSDANEQHLDLSVEYPAYQFHSRARVLAKRRAQVSTANVLA